MEITLQNLRVWLLSLMAVLLRLRLSTTAKLLLSWQYCQGLVLGKLNYCPWTVFLQLHIISFLATLLEPERTSLFNSLNLMVYYVLYKCSCCFLNAHSCCHSHHGSNSCHKYFWYINQAKSIHFSMLPILYHEAPA
ncbi:unnamed protein product [Vicia faba]|uniref:Secreted protein n=1 Tax=Vicia faba TaxID=3906 RepID=A0AAV1B8X2_VICFA|nr:unnamed protein product [Vicia faba]